MQIQALRKVELEKGRNEYIDEGTLCWLGDCVPEGTTTVGCDPTRSTGLGVGDRGVVEFSSPMKEESDCRVDANR